MNEESIQRLIARYLAGELFPAEAKVLSAELRGNAAAREWLREMSLDAVAIGELAAMRQHTPAPNVVKVRPFSRKPLVAWGIAAALAVAGFIAWPLPGGRAILEVAEVQGAASWSGGDGRVRVELTKGARLHAGRIETENDLSTAVLRFADGTLVTLSGAAELAFSENDGKRLTLTRGAFSATVTPQRAGRPLRVCTTVSDVEVMGTAFALEAWRDHSSLRVTEGRVKVRRLVDGREVEVAAEQQVTTSLDEQASLEPQQHHTPPVAWREDFSTAPENARGEWRAGDPNCLAAVPFVGKRKPDGTAVVLQGLSVRGGDMAVITPDSVLRLRVRVQRRVALQLMVSTHFPGGGFSGNFEHALVHQNAVPAGGWQTIEVPLSDFRSIHPDLSTAAVGHTAHVVIITSYNQVAGLEVAEIAIAPHPTSAP